MATWHIKKTVKKNHKKHEMYVRILVGSIVLLWQRSHRTHVTVQVNVMSWQGPVAPTLHRYLSVSSNYCSTLPLVSTSAAEKHMYINVLFQCCVIGITWNHKKGSLSDCAWSTTRLGLAAAALTRWWAGGARPYIRVGMAVYLHRHDVGACCVL